MRSTSQVHFPLCSGPVGFLKQTLSSSRESDEARLTDASCFWYGSGYRNTAEQYGGKRVPHRHK